VLVLLLGNTLRILSNRCVCLTIEVMWRNVLVRDMVHWIRTSASVVSNVLRRLLITKLETFCLGMDSTLLLGKYKLILLLNRRGFYSLL